MGEFDDLIGDFLIESNEHLEQLEGDLVSLERNPSDRIALTCIFRSIHTIKGNCGFLGFPRLEALTHAGESLLVVLRDDNIAPDSETISLLLELVDAVRLQLQDIERLGSEDATRDLNASLVPRLDAARDELQRPTEAPNALFPSAQPPLDQAPIQLDTDTEPHAQPPLITEDEVEELDDAAPAPRASPKASELLTSGVYGGLPGFREPRDELDSEGSQSLIDGDVDKSRGEEGPRGELNVRVDTSLLDEIMNLVGELVIARNQLQQCSARLADDGLRELTAQVNSITSLLQDRVMKTRMQPIERVLNKFPRLVRNVSRLCQKSVRLELEGLDTELDRSLIEAIRDPLTHLVRNAIDHGLEGADGRIAAGKPAEGLLRIRATHQDGQVHIEIFDDGRGIDPARIRERLLSQRLIPESEARALTDADVIGMIFLPGLSTSEKVTRLSGRGVGMDVVKTNIENLGGKVGVATMLGQWSRFTVSIPLTLAIIPSLGVLARGHRFALPQANLIELVRIDESNDMELDELDGRRLFRLRDRLLPLVDLREELDAASPPPELTAKSRLLVLRDDESDFGVLVDAVTEYQEIVVKPLDPLLTPIELFSGSTILESGQVALILDVRGLARRAGVRSQVARPVRLTRDEAPGPSDDAVSMLLFRVGEDWRMGVPLASVGRLEEVPLSALEVLDKQEVFRFQGRLVPIVRLCELFEASHPDVGGPGEVLSLIVAEHEGRSVGLVVEEVLDIVEEEVRIQEHEPRLGIYGSAVLGGRATDLVDLNEVVAAACTMLLGDPSDGPPRG